MDNKIVKFLFSTVLTFIVIFTAPVFASEGYPLKILVSHEINQSGDTVMIFEIHNLGNESVRLSEDILPWAGGILSSRSTVIIPVTLNQDKKQLKQSFDFIDYHSHVDVPPKKSISGEINLNHTFPEFRKTRLSTDILVFWSVKLPDSKKRSYERFGGSFELSKTQ